MNEIDLWRDKTELLNLRLSKLPSTKVLLKLDFDTKDQVLLIMLLSDLAKMFMKWCSHSKVLELTEDRQEGGGLARDKVHYGYHPLHHLLHGHGHEHHHEQM